MKKHFLITTCFVMSLANFLLGVDSNPTMARIQGNQYTTGIADTQPAGAVGTLVPTGIFGTNGSLSLAAQAPGSVVTATQVLSNGIIAVLLNDDVNTYVVEYSANGAVNTSFASGTGNILELTGYAASSRFMTVDEQGRLLLSGADDGSSLPWISRIMPAGTIDTNFTFTDGASWTTAGAINQLGTQLLGQIVAVGSNGTNSMIARYNLDGSIDTTFGATGYVVLDGSISGSGTLPVATVAIYNIVIDAQNNIYIAYVDATPSVNVIRLTPAGILDTTWNAGIPVNISYLDGVSMQTNQLSMIIDSLDDLVVAVPSGSPVVIKAASLQSATGAAGTFANFATSGGVFGTDNYALFTMMATIDGSVYFLGSDTTTKQMAVIRCTNAGILDTTFNGTGINFFYPSGFTPTNSSMIFAGSIAPDGQIFVGGGQFNSGVIYPYLSSLYNDQYVNAVRQYPATQEQGTLDTAFGTASVETYAGVMTPFVGLYRSALQQQAESVIELISGNVLLGMNGYTGLSPLLSNMMLIRLLPTGALDLSFGTSGQLILPNITGTNEYLTSLLEDTLGNIYITGYSDSGAIFRKYTAAGMLLWNRDYLVTGFQGLGCGFESTSQILLYLGGPSNTGQINAYLTINGSVDTGFNNEGTVPGQLLYSDYGLDMGPLYNGIVDPVGSIFVAFKDSVDGVISVVSIVNNAAEINWESPNVFGTTGIDANNVRIAFNQDGNIVVAASASDAFRVTILDVVTGFPIPAYTTPLIISCGTTIELKQVIGISDDTIVLVGYDLTGNAMLAARVTSAGAIDVTFDSQGPLPGVTAIQIGNQIAGYYARVASGITVQSHTGSNQGNLVMSGYEQLFSTDATPMVMRLFGEPGTTQVPSNQRTVITPGTLDHHYNPTGTTPGIADTYVLGASTPAANQEVRAIREAFAGSQIMTIVTDNNTSISYTQRLNADSSIDTTYGSGLGIAIAQLSGTEVLQSMVYDGSGNLLVTGSNSSSGGYLKRILPTGLMDQTFGGLSGNPAGTTYGLMDVINACQQLTNGNIVIVGSAAGVGMIQMINSVGALVTTFGTSGSIVSGSNITSVSVDPSNNIYASVVYDAGSQINARIVKLNAAGQPVTAFGASGIIDPALSDIDGGDSLRLVFDEAYRPVIAASFGGSSGQVAVQRYNPDGSIDNTFNGGVQSVISFTNATNIFVTGLVALQDNRTLISGYQQDDITIANNAEFLACLDAFGVLDTSFGSDLNGLVTFQASDTDQLARRLINMNVQTNGNILLCGGEVPLSNEETPLTFRFYGYPDVQPVPQFTGYQPTPTLPSPLNLAFNVTGISATPIIDHLLHFGNIAVDSIGRSLIGGITSTGFFVIARYLRNGLLDTAGFGVDGIATSNVAVTGLSGGYLAIDASDNVYIGGVDGGISPTLIVARFTEAGALDTAHFGTAGIATSSSIPHLHKGGFVLIDPLGKSVVGGYTIDGHVVATRFLIDGTIDSSFASTSLIANVASVPIPGLVFGGSIGRDSLDNLYLGGRTSLDTLFIVSLQNDGTINTDFNPLGTVPGIAETPIIDGLVDGGTLALDGNDNITIGGLTANQSFVVAQFLSIGDLNPFFNETGTTPGIAYSNSVNVLDVFGNVAIDSSDNVIVGGSSSNYGGSNSMIVANFTSKGILNTTFTSVGMATTGTIPNLVVGGAVATDVYDNIFIGGLTNLPGFVMAQMYSGQEIFVTDTTILNPQDLKTYYYGNDPIYLTLVLSALYFAQVITDTTVREAVLSSVANTLADYVVIYSGQPGWNLVWHLYRQLSIFEDDRKALLILFADFTNEINSFYAKLETRIVDQEYSS